MNALYKKHLLTYMLIAYAGGTCVPVRAGFRESWEWVKKNKLKAACYTALAATGIGAVYLARRNPEKVTAFTGAAQEKLSGLASNINEKTNKTLDYLFNVGTKLTPIVAAYSTWKSIESAGNGFITGGWASARIRIQASINSQSIIRNGPAYIQNLLNIIRNPQAQLPKGIILHGPPGTGKTELIRAIAGAYGNNVSVYHLDVGAHVSPQRNQTAKNIADSIWAMKWNIWILRLLDRNHKAIIFIDEFERVASKRSFAGDGDARDDSKTTSTLLEYIDGLHSDPNIIYIGATNSLASIDNAIQSRMVPVEMPLPTAKNIRNMITDAAKFTITQTFDTFINQAQFTGWSYRNAQTFLRDVNNAVLLSNENNENETLTQALLNNIYQNIDSSVTRNQGATSAGHAAASSSSQP